MCIRDSIYIRVLCFAVTEQLDMNIKSKIKTLTQCNAIEFEAYMQLFNDIKEEAGTQFFRFLTPREDASYNYLII